MKLITTLVFLQELDFKSSEGFFSHFRFRGLKSFRTTPWDPKENLPFDYAKIYQFENPKRTRKYVVKKHTGVEQNEYVSLHLKNVHINILGIFLITLIYS